MLVFKLSIDILQNEKYLAPIPRIRPFYRRPIQSSLGLVFSSQTGGITTLVTCMKRMFVDARINTNGRNVTNHSGKATCCTALYYAMFISLWKKLSINNNNKSSSQSEGTMHRVQFFQNRLCYEFVNFRWSRYLHHLRALFRFKCDHLLTSRHLVVVTMY